MAFNVPNIAFFCHCYNHNEMLGSHLYSNSARNPIRFISVNRPFAPRRAQAVFDLGKLFQQGNQVHMIVSGPSPVALARFMMTVRKRTTLTMQGLRTGKRVVVKVGAHPLSLAKRRRMSLPIRIVVELKSN
jgi:hypothetical protein